MQNNLLSRLKYAQFNSALVRNMLKFVYRDNKQYKIPFGPLRGGRLVYKPYINFHMMLGLWELENAATLKKIMESHVFKGPIVACDVGANVGMLSLWLSKYLPRGSTIYAFEPTQYICEILRQNISINHVSNVTVVPYACADVEGQVEFFEGAHHHRSSLIGDWAASGATGTSKKVSVKATTLDAFFKGKEPPSFIKMDIEGGGIFALKGCSECFERSRPFLFIESHMPEEDQAISDLVLRFDYAVYRLDTKSWVKSLNLVHPYSDGIWGNVLACPSEKKEDLQRILQ